MTTTRTGYCGHCHTIVDLDLLNRLAPHGRRFSDNAGAWAKFCDGTGEASATVPDTLEVAAAAFSSERRRARCSKCDNPDAVQRCGEGGRLYMRGHLPPGGRESDPLCPGSWYPPEYEES